jgi:hypothetical protein
MVHAGIAFSLQAFNIRPKFVMASDGINHAGGNQWLPVEELHWGL